MADELVEYMTPADKQRLAERLAIEAHVSMLSEDVSRLKRRLRLMRRAMKDANEECCVQRPNTASDMLTAALARDRKEARKP